MTSIIEYIKGYIERNVIPLPNVELDYTPFENSIRVRLATANTNDNDVYIESTRGISIDYANLMTKAELDNVLHDVCRKLNNTYSDFD